LDHGDTELSGNGWNIQGEKYTQTHKTTACDYISVLSMTFTSRVRNISSWLRRKTRRIRWNM